MPCGDLLGKGLTSWHSFVMSNCEAVTFSLVSLVRCGAKLYRFLIFVLFLTLITQVTNKGSSSTANFIFAVHVKLVS